MPYPLMVLHPRGYDPRAFSPGCTAVVVLLSQGPYRLDVVVPGACGPFPRGSEYSCGRCTTGGAHPIPINVDMPPRTTLRMALEGMPGMPMYGMGMMPPQPPHGHAGAGADSEDRQHVWVSVRQPNLTVKQYRFPRVWVGYLSSSMPNGRVCRGKSRRGG